jgi:predicted SnoaL-like aldol condensation-catalyzing enzyme
MLKGKSRIVLSLLFICLLAFLGFFMADQYKEKAAVNASKAWLKLVDEGKHSESWDEAAKYFKNAITKEQWKTSLESVRSPLGKVLSRKLKSKKYTKTLPGAPDGEYVVIKYETSFQNKQQAIETITPMLDKDGKWRVSGYYIK